MSRIILIVCAALLLAAPISAYADSREAARNAEAAALTPSSAIIGKPAPDFSATDSHGQIHTLSTLKGKTIVLEWTNDQCPFVRKFYDSETMQKMQQDAVVKGVLWFTIVSSAKGREGFTDADGANRDIVKEKSNETARLLDPTGTLGHLYGASATPHMFIIDKNGILVYAGAVDDQPSVSPSSLKGATNYITTALNDLASGKQVAVTSSKVYGCSVKY